MSTQDRCLNLVELFGKTLRTGWDPAYIPDYQSVPKRCRDPWLMTIPCRGGIVIYPYGGNRLAVEIDHHGILAKRVAQIPGVICTQNGEREKTYVFDLSLFDQVAAIVKPKKRRILTPEQRAKLLSATSPEQRLKRLAKARAAAQTQKAALGV